jgi:hypothetical protein
VQLVGGAVLELRDEVEVAVPCLLRLAVHEQATAADVLADHGDALDDSTQERRTQALTLVVTVHPQSGEQRHGVAAGTLA